MHGGVKIYRGSAAAARNYVEADRPARMTTTWPRAPVSAQRYAARPERRCGVCAPLDGDEYEAWVAGFDPDTGAAEGPAAHRRPGGAVRRGDRQRAEVVVAGRRTAPRDRGGVRRRAGPRRGADHRLAGRARDHPGRSARRAGPGAGRARSRRRSCATTRRGRAIRTGTCTCRSTPGCSPTGRWRGLHTVGVRDSHRCDQRHRARRGDDRPGVPGGAGRARLHASTPAPARSPSWPTYVGPFSARAAQIEPQHRPLRGRAGARASGRGARSAAAPGRGMRGRGPTPARTRSSPVSGEDLAGGGWASSADLGFVAPSRPRQVARVRPGGLDHRAAVVETCWRGSVPGARRGTPPTSAARSSSSSLRRRGRRRRRPPRARRGPHRARRRRLAPVARPRRRARAHPGPHLAPGARGRARARHPDRPPRRRETITVVEGAAGSGKTQRSPRNERRLEARGVSDAGRHANQESRPGRSRRGRYRSALRGVAAAPARLPLGAQKARIPFGWCSTQSTCLSKVSAWSAAARIRDATLSDGDFSPRSYAESVARDVPDNDARRAWVRPRARRARSRRYERSM